RMLASDGALTTTGEGSFIQIVRGQVQSIVGADIELFLEGPTGAFEIFSEIPYTITVVNNGPLDARDVLVDLPQPDGMVYTRSSATQGRYNLFFEHWAVDNLAAGDTATMHLTLFTLEDANPIDFFIEVQGGVPADPDSRPFNGIAPIPMEDDEAVFTIFPEPRPIGGDTADLRLDIRATQEEFVAFSDATFELIVTNDGPDAAANVRVSALFPEGMVFTSAEASQGEYNVVAQDWYIPLIESGASDTLALTLFALIEGQPLILFSQIIASDQFDPDSTPANDLDNVPDEDDEARAVITPQGGIQGGTESDLELTLEIDRPDYERFTNYTYTFTLTNNGPDDASNILIDAQLPDSLAYTSKAASIGDWNNFFQFWGIPYLRAGEQHTLKLVLFTLAKEEPITFFTQILGVDQNDPDSEPANNQTGVPEEDDESTVTLTPVQPTQPLHLFGQASSQVQGTLYPSPASERVHLNLHTEHAQTVTLQLTNANGQLLKQLQMPLHEGLNQLEYDVTLLATGIYHVHLIDSGQQRKTWKFVKVGQ
ncbi:MAG: T9SS type A sorting domain-containing protein, partial [Bacteroidota bacterium]